MKTEGKRLKQWVTEEAIREKRTVSAIWNRLGRGEYADIVLHRINRRVIFVLPPEPKRREKPKRPKKEKYSPPPGWIRQSLWIGLESKRTGASIRAIYIRLSRGRYASIIREKYNGHDYVVKASSLPLGI